MFGLTGLRARNVISLFRKKGSGYLFDSIRFLFFAQWGCRIRRWMVCVAINFNKLIIASQILAPLGDICETDLDNG